MVPHAITSLAKQVLAAKLDGTLVDASLPIEVDAKIELVTAKDPEGLELIRHDAAHVLAEAVQELFPGTQVTIGPVIENGFYYDFHRDEPFSADDFAAIEKKMAFIINRNDKFEREVMERDAAIKLFRETCPRARPSQFISKANGLISAVARICRARARSGKPSN